MKRNLALTSLVALALGVTVLPAGAQVTTTTTTTTGPVTTQSQVTTTVAPGLSGQVSQMGIAESADQGVFKDVIYKTITLEPGEGQFTFDTLNWQDTVQLTLVNPTDMPLQFETTQRWGKELKTVVPANSQQVVQFRFGRPVADEVKYVVFESPQSAVARIAQSQIQTQAAAPVEAETVTTVQQIQPVPQQTESQSAVRGYW